VGDDMFWLGEEALKNGFREKREELLVLCVGCEGGAPKSEVAGD